MSLSNFKKEQIAHSVIKVLYSRFNSFPENVEGNRNAPFHEAFLNAFGKKLQDKVNSIPDLISLSSWMQGLNTALGESFFESVAHILCDGEKMSFKGKQIYQNQKSIINEIITDLKNANETPNVTREESLIERNKNGAMCPAIAFTADCFYETTDEVVAIELKSVRPNSGEMKGEKQKMLEGKALLKQLYPQKIVRYYMGFPFDPTANTNIGYDKSRFLDYLVEAKKFLALDDILIADGLWSFLAGEESGIMQEIIDIINKIATPEFMDIYQNIQSYTPDKAEEYRQIFNDWYLYTEVAIMDRVSYTKQNSRLFNQRIFNTNGDYNEKRARLLQ